MNKEELELYVKKFCENFFKKLAENPEEMLNLSYLQDKYNNLLKEKIELKKQYCERTDCGGRIGNSKKVEELQQENKQLKEVINKAIDWLVKYQTEWCQEDEVIRDLKKVLDILKEVE